MKKIESNNMPTLSAEVDSLGKNEWYSLLNRFNDANLYQTWAYGKVRWGEPSLSHLILKENNEIIAAAQVRTVKIPLLNRGIAFVRWGPLWRLKNREVNTDIFRLIIRALRVEYAEKRNLLLRIMPIIIDNKTLHTSILYDEKFYMCKNVTPERTIMIDMSPSIGELRAGLKRSWRKNLNRAEKMGLELIEGNHLDLKKSYMDIYRQMKRRKKFVQFDDTNDFVEIQNELPALYKMNVMVCKYEGMNIAAAGTSLIGNTALDTIAATTETALKVKASFLIRWNQLKMAKQRGFQWFDLGGIDPEDNPGGYHFKSGWAGSNGKDVQFIGEFETWADPVSMVAAKIPLYLRTIVRKLKMFLYRLGRGRK